MNLYFCSTFLVNPFNHNHKKGIVTCVKIIKAKTPKTKFQKKLINNIVMIAAPSHSEYRSRKKTFSSGSITSNR